METKSPRQRVFAVGLGLNQLEDKLAQIASVTNGVAHITGDLVGWKEFLLQKLYVQILSDAADEAFVKDPVNLLLPGQRLATPVRIGDVDVAADFIVVLRRTPVHPEVHADLARGTGRHRSSRRPTPDRFPTSSSSTPPTTSSSAGCSRPFPAIPPLTSARGRCGWRTPTEPRATTT